MQILQLSFRSMRAALAASLQDGACLVPTEHRMLVPNRKQQVWFQCRLVQSEAPEPGCSDSVRPAQVKKKKKKKNSGFGSNSVSKRTVVWVGQNGAWFWFSGN